MHELPEEELKIEAREYLCDVALIIATYEANDDGSSLKRVLRAYDSHLQPLLASLAYPPPTLAIATKADLASVVISPVACLLAFIYIYIHTPRICSTTSSSSNNNNSNKSAKSCEAVALLGRSQPVSKTTLLCTACWRRIRICLPTPPPSSSSYHHHNRPQCVGVWVRGCVCCHLGLEDQEKQLLGVVAVFGAGLS